MGARTFTKDEHKNIVTPIVDKLVHEHYEGKTTIVALQGGQGTGKTTIADHIKKELYNLGFKVQSFSIDNFYTSAKERKALQKKYPNNPFYQIPRGMPGTHKVKTLHNLLDQAKKGKPFIIPHFDKSKLKGFGDILKRTTKIKDKQDFIIFEGWCVGLPSIKSAELKKISLKHKIPLEKIDPDKGRNIVLRKIKPYLPLWRYIDYFIMIYPDSSSCHKLWRLLQEQRLKKSKHQGMSSKQISHFVDVYLPLTYVCYDKIHWDAQIKVDKLHNYYDVKFIKE